MKKILIVDDNKTNRMTINFMLDEWSEEHSCQFIVVEAEDGKDAIDKASKDMFDIIFMDIMMPNINGIEATKKIRESGKKDLMIIAVSALDDNESKNKILQAGAEDYITKPVNEDIFKKRLSHYLSLVDSRRHKKFNAEAINLFDTQIYSRRLTFVIKNQNSLSEFWDYYLLDDSKYTDRLTDLVRVIYGLGLLQIKLKYNFEIVVEESNNSIYFTMSNIKLLNPILVNKIISKNYNVGEYKILDDKLTFKFIKSTIVEEKQNIVQDSRVENIEDVAVEKSNQEIQIFNFIEGEDIEELESIANELNSLIMLIGSSSLNIEEVLQISSYIHSFARILATYRDTFEIANAISSLASNIESNTEIFRERSKEIALLCQAFNRDLLLWIRKLFYEGAPSIDFLDSSIISNANMISNFIVPQDSNAVDALDDIFDF